MKWTQKEPKYGDIIRVKVSFYYHYGIFSDENTIIQFGRFDNSGTHPDEICVLSTSVEEFSNGNIIEVSSFSFSEKRKKRSPGEIVKIATERLGERGYHILHNNCEHFVTDCVFGEKTSFLDSVRDDIRNKIK